MNLKCLFGFHDETDEADRIKDPAGGIVQPIHCSRCETRLRLERDGSWYPDPDMEVNGQ